MIDMCRYSDPNYRSVYACFNCRIAWKGPRAAYRFPNRLSPGSYICGRCGKDGVNMGRDFTAPRRNQVNQWKKLALMTKNGTIKRYFDSCGCGPMTPTDMPATLADAKRRQSGGNSTGLSRRTRRIPA